MTKVHTLLKLKQKIIKGQTLPHYQTATFLVFDEGDVGPKILFLDSYSSLF